MRVEIVEWSDSVDIIIHKDDTEPKRFNIYADEGHQNLVDVFKYLGIETTYEEAY